MSSKELADMLETNGWTRATAGDADFEAAVKALEMMQSSGRGILISGTYGVGKTALATIIAHELTRHELLEIHLARADQLERLSKEWLDYYALNPYNTDTFLDDLGAEKLVNEYGVKSEVVGDFIVSYHERHRLGTRMIITTNFSVREVDARYGGRVVSRLKDLCIPLHLSGKDKREWKLAL